MINIREYRGHIRNWRALCRTLQVDAALDRAERERALIAKAYETYGPETMGLRLQGMFAFALEDTEKNLLLLLRDPFGTKPMYYYETADGKLLFGTLLRDLMAQEGFEKRFSEKLLQIYLTMTYTPGDETFYAGVKKLMPGHFLLRKDGKTTVTRYWHPSFRPDETTSLEAFADEIDETLKEIMTEIREEDESPASFLSGGVDSSYVLALSDARVAASCGYDDERLDESRLAAETAALLKRDFSRCLVTPQMYFDAVEYVMRGMEQPLGDASAVAFAIGCREIAKTHALCYSGEGSDEFFGGYNMYRNAERYGDNLKNFYVGNTNIMKEEEKAALLLRYDPAHLPIDYVREIYRENEGCDPLTRMSDIDIRVWLEGDIYLNVDKMSTAAGLEIRMPITDLRIFEIASRMPSRFKVNETDNKVAFRTAAAKHLPQEIAFRKKLGFVVPIRYWMADERYNGDVRKRLGSDLCAQFFHMDEVKKIFDAYIAGDSDLWRKVWVIYTFLTWYDVSFG